MPVMHLIHVTTEMIKLLQYIYKKGLISYIKTLFKIKNNGGCLSLDNDGLSLQLETYFIL